MNDDYRLVRDDMFFTWDDEKAIINWKKHRVTFETASRIFLDKYAVIFPDELHSDSEDREIIIGTVNFSAKHKRILFVVYVERIIGDDKKLFRIISARDAKRKEKIIYERNLPGRLPLGRR